MITIVWKIPKMSYVWESQFYKKIRSVLMNKSSDFLVSNVLGGNIF